MLLLLPAIFGDGARRVAAAAARQPVLAWLGLISYGIFLYHGPLVLWLQQHEADDVAPRLGLPLAAVVAVAMAIAAATLSYYLVERPLLRFKDAPRGSSSAEPPRGGAGLRRRLSRLGERAPGVRVVRLVLGRLAGERGRLVVAALGVQRAGDGDERGRAAARLADAVEGAGRRALVAQGGVEDRPPARPGSGRGRAAARRGRRR